MDRRARLPSLLGLMAVITVLAVLGSAPIASAITNGQPDGNGHPYVGVLVFDVGGQPAFLCSGSLIAPTVVLTAGHCTSGTTGARIWFDSTVTDPKFPFGGGTSIEATAIFTNPGFCIGCAPGLPGFDTHDQGIVILSHAVTGKGFAVLPSQGLVDALPMKSAVALVGYGGQVQTRGIPPHQWLINLSRYLAPSQLVQSNDVISAEFIKLTANPSQGKGGICFGDSGGPDLLGNIVLAVNSFVTNGNCAGVTYSNRIDTADNLAFIKSHL
ncbi:MAG TPA: trypsin-like serine protease [Terriglobales bacterium]|nr:trypsin-like serine protease [Terriglobales bacterium]